MPPTRGLLIVATVWLCLDLLICALLCVHLSAAAQRKMPTCAMRERELNRVGPVPLFNCSWVSNCHSICRRFGMTVQCTAVWTYDPSGGPEQWLTSEHFVLVDLPGCNAIHGQAAGCAAGSGRPVLLPQRFGGLHVLHALARQFWAHTAVHSSLLPCKPLWAHHVNLDQWA